MRLSHPPVLVLAAALVAAVAFRADAAQAQAKPEEGTIYTWADASLETALSELADLAGVSLVFAHRVVEGQQVSGYYKVGEEPTTALEQMLADTGLRAERIRRGRYVIIAEPLNVPLEPDDPAAYTGTLDGRIVDAETGEPLWGAHAWLVDLDLGGVADLDGWFSVPRIPTGEYVVRFSHIGYKPVRVRLSVYPVSPQLPPAIRLQAEAITTEDAVVRASDTPELELGLTELTSRQAAALPVYLGEGDLAQTLAWLPGLARAGAGGGELAVRGADPHLTRYLRDGVPFIQPWHAFGLFSAFQPETAERVRLHRGALPASLGDGLAAVVEVDTKDGRERGGIASLSPVSLRAVAEVPINPRVGLLVAGRRSTLDWLFSPTLRQEAGAVVLDPLGTLGTEAGQDVAHRFYDAEAKLTWELASGQTLALGGYLGGDRLDARLRDTLRPGAPDRLVVDDRWTNQQFSARYRVLGRRIFLTAIGYHTRYRLDEQTRALDTADVPLERDYGVVFQETGLKVDVDYFRSLRHQLYLGGHLARQALTTELGEAVVGEGSRAQRTDADGIEGALYVQDTWQPNERLAVRVGLRAEAYSAGRYVNINPRVQVRYTAQPGRLHLRAGVSRQTQSLHRVRDRYAYTYDLAASRWLLPSSRVRPASGWQLGAGAEWVPSSGLAFSLDAYTRVLNDVLEPIDAFGAGQALLGPGVEETDLLRFYRPSRGRAYGLEVAGRAEHGPWLVGLSYALARSEVLIPGNDAWQVSRYDRPHVLGLLAQRRGRHWSAAARLTVQSGLPTAVLDDEGTVIGRARFTAETRLDLSVGYRFGWLGLGWDAQIQAFNLTGRRIFDPSPFTDGTAALLATDVRGLPMIPVLSLKATW